MKQVCRWIALAAFTGMTAALAQDTRHVTEPVVPRTCAVLRAQLTASGSAPSSAGAAHQGNGGFAAADEARLDTERLQNAIDNCGGSAASPKAVELSAADGHRAFLSGPLSCVQGWYC